MEETESVRKSPFYQQLAKIGKGFIDKDIERGNIPEQNARWDEKDEKEFSNIPFEVLLDDPYYGGGDLWPVHRQDIIDLWEARRRYGVHTYVAIEGIGSGKTHKFKHVLRLMVLEVVTKVNPLKYYGLSEKGQGISFVCMSRNASLAKEVTYKTILQAFNCGFFKEHFPPNIDFNRVLDAHRYPQMLRFSRNVVIFPGTGSALSAVGYNLMGGGIDEANYLEVIDDSKRAINSNTYDAAEMVYNAIMTRMKSRFLSKGKLPGLLMMFSNTKHSNDFLERMAVRSKTDSTIFFRRRCTWDGIPKERLSGETFKFDVYNNKIVE